MEKYKILLQEDKQSGISGDDETGGEDEPLAEKVQEKAKDEPSTEAKYVQKWSQNSQHIQLLIGKCTKGKEPVERLDHSRELFLQHTRYYYRRIFLLLLPSFAPHI